MRKIFLPILILCFGCEPIEHPKMRFKEGEIVQLRIDKQKATITRVGYDDYWVRYRDNLGEFHEMPAEEYELEPLEK